jgi:Ni2+-binding GTPase involved in maturation of urease and hydrogenase
MFSFVQKVKTPKKNVITTDVLTILESVKSVGTGYEVITGACIPYYDFEREYDTESEQLANYKTDLKFAITSLDMYFDKSRNCKVFEFTACGFDPIKKKYKNSFHFRVRGFGYHNNTSEITKIDGFDSAVYNTKSQLFRLPYCTKEKQNRYLKRFNSATGEVVELVDLTEPYESYLVQNIENEVLVGSHIVSLEKVETINIDISMTDEITELIKKATDANPMFNDFIYKSHKTNTIDISNSGISIELINFKRLRSSYCKTCDRTHDKDATPYIFIRDNKMFWSCIRNKKAQFICKVDDSIADVKYTSTSIVKLNNAIDYMEQYCTNIKELTDSIKNNTHSVIAVKSNMGSGKTYAIAECINEMGKNLQTAGVVSFRVSLANKYTTDFKGFTCYNTKKQKIIDDDKWVCQADSIHRIKPTEKPLEILVLDEVDQLRKHMTAETFMKNSNYLSNRAGLKQLIKTTKQVVIMSANITKADLDWIDSMRGSSVSKLIINNRYVSDPREINMVCKNKIIESIIDDFKHKKKFAIAHNGSVKKQDALKRQILRSNGHSPQTEQYDILLINSETMSDANVKLALENPNIEFGKYAGIIYSPSVQSGLSYDVRDTIHSIYGIFGNATNSTNDACQMLHRIRNPVNKQIMVSIEIYNSGSKPTTVNAMMKHLKNARSHIYSNSKDIDTMAIIEKLPFDYNNYGEIEFMQSDILHEYCVNKSEHNLDSIWYKDNFIKAQKEYGNTIIYDADKGQKKTTITNKAINKEVDLEIATKLHEAVLIDDAAKIELKKKIDNSPESVGKEEYTQLKKKNIIDTYKVSGDSPQWYLTYGNSATKKHYNSLSEYYTKNQSLELSLAELKKKEIVNDVYSRINIDTAKETEQCIIDNILNKPKYMKHRVLINWLLVLGYTTLDDKLEIKADDMKAHLAVILNNMTDEMMNCLEKSNRKLEAIKKLKITDAKFVGNILQFINGSLKSEFGISIKKKSKNSNEYILLNAYVKNEIFFNPFVENEEDPYIPILGKHKYVCPIRTTDENDEPYDSDEE